MEQLRHLCIFFAFVVSILVKCTFLGEDLFSVCCECNYSLLFMVGILCSSVAINFSHLFDPFELLILNHIVLSVGTH